METEHLLKAFENALSRKGYPKGVNSILMEGFNMQAMTLEKH
ncbi:hypothetical protein LEP1GSC161_1017 [Leptospira santarosai str. CBC1416]|uniref:Uncharacterized protein n=1 Tax=Leptospira santarosai str. CBC1416 TaxID=1193059 RepID=M6WBI1_9LEPT|nr:hypothetical protein LEP1GSC165_3826 [Leptospira santarosai str. CBC523]EMO59123.1 hypothetical protein LEP1GSC161_1017 [Leptospira santarosai str. CBC1416]